MTVEVGQSQRVCNRFNYEMHNDPAYHNLINESVGKDNAKIILQFKPWAEAYKAKFIEAVRPIGVSIDKPLSEKDLERLVL